MSMVSSKAPSWVAYCSHYLKFWTPKVITVNRNSLQQAFSRIVTNCVFFHELPINIICTVHWSIFLARCLKTLDSVRTEFYDLRGKFQTMLQVLQFVWSQPGLSLAWMDHMFWFCWYLFGFLLSRVCTDDKYFIMAFLAITCWYLMMVNWNHV
jgi:hypothetical protein